MSKATKSFFGDHGYAHFKTNEALELLMSLKLTEQDFLHLAAACADQGGVPSRTLEKIEELLGLVP